MNFSFQLRREDYFEGGREHHVLAAKSISKSIELKNYINTQFIDVD